MSVEQFVMAHGVSIGKTHPAYPEEVQTVYPPTGLHGAERRRHPLPAGAGRLYGGL